MKLIKTAILLLPLLLLAAPLGQHSQGSTPSTSLEHQAQKAYDSGFYKQAISLLGKALKLHPNNPRILTNLGSAENEALNYSGAIIFYKRALEKNPHNVGALVGLGAAVYMLNGGGVKYFKEALREPVSTTVGKLERALALTYLHNYTQVISILNQLPQSVDILNSKAIILMDQKNYAGSLFYLKKALKLSPHNPTIFYNMGLVNMFLGNFATAVDDYTQVLKIMPNDKDALYGKKLAIQSLEDSLYNNGKALNDQGKYSQALSYLKQALALNSSDTHALVNMGYSLLGLGHYADSIHYFDQVLKVQPKRVSTLINMGLSLYELKNYTGSLKLLDAAVGWTPIHWVNCVRRIWDFRCR